MSELLDPQIDQLFPHLTPVVRRVWEFDRQEDFDWNSQGVGCVFPLSLGPAQSGQAPFVLSATDLEGFTACALPACVYLGRGTYARMKWWMQLTAVQFAHFAFGLAAPEHGWLGSGKYLGNGFVLRTDSGDNNIDLVVASGNTSSSYPAESATTQDAVRLMGTGWALWSMELFTDPSELGKGWVRLFVNDKIFHAQEVRRVPFGTALCPAFGIFNGEAATRTLTLDRVELEYGRYTTTSLTPATVSSGDGGGGGGGNGGGGGGSDCIAAGTLVTMYDGARCPVEQLKPGDMLKGQDGPVRLLELRDVGQRPCVVVKTFMGEEVVCTREHPFMVQGEQVQAGDLIVPGSQDRPQGESEEGMIVFRSVEPTGDHHVFSLTVEEGVFYANGVLTHNKATGGGPATMPPGSMPN